MNPDDEECFGISTVSGIQMALTQGQKVYNINYSNSEQLSNVSVSDSNMASDLSTAVSSGGFVYVPEKAVYGSGRSAIYAYMTYNGQTGAQAWKISGGLNGGSFNFFEDVLSEFQIAGINIMSLSDVNISNAALQDMMMAFIEIVGEGLGKVLTAFKNIVTGMSFFIRLFTYIDEGCRWSAPFLALTVTAYSVLIGWIIGIVTMALLAIPIVWIAIPLAIAWVVGTSLLFSAAFEGIDDAIIEEICHDD